MRLRTILSISWAHPSKDLVASNFWKCNFFGLLFSLLCYCIEINAPSYKPLIGENLFFKLWFLFSLKSMLNVLSQVVHPWGSNKSGRTSKEWRPLAEPLMWCIPIRFIRNGDIGIPARLNAKILFNMSFKILEQAISLQFAREGSLRQYEITEHM